MIYRIKYFACEECDHSEDLSLCMRDKKEAILCEECFEKITSYLTKQQIRDIRADELLDQWKDEREGRN